MKTEGTWKPKPEGGNAEVQRWILGDAKGKQTLGENGRKQRGREIWNGGRQRAICQTGGLAVKRCEEKYEDCMFTQCSALITVSPPVI